MTVDISPGRVETIDLLDGDSAAYSAELFCQNHAVSTKLVAPLTAYIQVPIPATLTSALRLSVCKKHPTTPAPN
jgi:hypothetical protein